MILNDLLRWAAKSANHRKAKASADDVLKLVRDLMGTPAEQERLRKWWGDAIKLNY